MNETSWLACTDPAALLAFHSPDLPDRKLRLFACACARRIWPLLTREPVRHAVLTAERYADGEASRDELLAGWYAVRKALSVTPLGTRWEDALMTALNASSSQIDAASAARHAAAALDADWRQQHTASRLPAHRERLHAGSPAERAYQCRLFRDLVPFHSVEADPCWRLWEGGQVVSMAQAIHDEQRWQDLPVLADALEEAGCRDERILAHCRAPGPHVHGCWVLDVLRGLE